MLYLLAIFVPPLALLIARKWVQGLIVSPIICVLAIFGLLFFLIPGIFLWLLAVLHAVLVINSKKADERTDKVVRAIERPKQAL